LGVEAESKVAAGRAATKLPWTTLGCAEDRNKPALTGVCARALLAIPEAKLTWLVVGVAMNSRRRSSDMRNCNLDICYIKVSESARKTG